MTRTDPIQALTQGWTAACPRCDVPAEWSARSMSYTLHYTMNCPCCGLVRWTPGQFHIETTEPITEKQADLLSRIARRIGLGR
jgi:hypothetical protein